MCERSQKTTQSHIIKLAVEQTMVKKMRKIRNIRKKKNWLMLVLAVILAIKLPQPYLRVMAETEETLQEENGPDTEILSGETGAPGDGENSGETGPSGDESASGETGPSGDEDTPGKTGASEDEENPDGEGTFGDEGNPEESTAAEEKVAIPETQTVAEPLDVTPYITAVDAWYQPKGGNGNDWIKIEGGDLKIPADAGLKFTIKYAGANAENVMNHQKALQYTLPELLIHPTVEHGDIKDNSNQSIGSITADTDTRTIRMTFTEDFLRKEEETAFHAVSGEFSFYAEADQKLIQGKPKQTLTIGKVNLTLPFETDSTARLGELKLTKSSGTFITDNGTSYLQYTLTVSTGDTTMPEVKVTDQFTANVTYIAEYLGVSGIATPLGSTAASDGTPYETGDGAGTGSVYLGNESTEAAPIPKPAGDTVTKPGVLVWNVGEMKAHQSRSLVYRVRLKPEYTGGQSKGTITNTAASYAMGYPHQSASTNFTSHTGVSIKKECVKYDPDATGGGGTILYQVTVQADKANTYPLKNLKINDNLKGHTANIYLPYLHYVEGSFCLYQGSKVDESKKVELGANPHPEQSSNPKIYDTADSEKRFDLYIPVVKAGETWTLTYRLRVEDGIFTVGNQTIEITNYAAAYSDDTVSGGNQRFSFTKPTKTLEKKVWDRKLQSKPMTEEQTVTTDTETSFTVPKGSFCYQVVVNEAADWNVASAIFKDKLKSHLVYTGFLRVDYYETGLSEGTHFSDADAVAKLKEKVIKKTVWVDINKKTTFTFTPTENGFETAQGAFLLTYYAKPDNMEGITQISSGNTFTLSGDVIGIGGNTLHLSGVQVSTSAILQGGKNLNVQKSGWYYDSKRENTGDWQLGRLYWVIDVTGTEIGAGMEFKDENVKDASIHGSATQHDMKKDSMVGLYIGTPPKGKGFTDSYVSVEELEADTGDGKSMKKLTQGTDYSWSQTKSDTAIVQIRKTQTLTEGQHLYIILRTSPTHPWGIRKEVWYTNRVSFRDSADSEFIQGDTAKFCTALGGNHFKELAGVYEYDGTTCKQVPEGNSNAKLDKTKIKKPGTYVEWRIKINYVGDSEGTVQVEDVIPAGLEPVYARYFWIDSGLRKAKKAPCVPEISEYENNTDWEKMESTGPIDGGGYNGTCIAYFNRATRQLRFDVTNLQKDDNTSPVDKKSLEIQVVTKLSDPTMMLDGTEKSYTNAITVRDASDKEVGNSSATVKLSKKTISKEMGTVDQGKLPFTLKINSLGEDLVEGSDTLTLVDEMKSPLLFDTESLQVVDKDNQPVAVTSRIETTKEGQKLILTIPDGKKLTITYSAILNCQPNTLFSVSNEAYWFGHSEGKAEVKQENLSYSVSATAGTSASPVLKVKKVDRNSTGTALPGAEFSLQQVEWDADQNQWTDTARVSPIKGTTGNDGSYSFGTTDGTLLDYNTVYRLTETKAPEGYILDTTPHYYVIAKKVPSEAGGTEAYPADLETWRENGAEIYYSGSTYQVTVYNEKGKLELRKIFQNVNGEQVTGSGIPDGVYRFGLYACAEDGSYDTAKRLQTLELTCTRGTVTCQLNGTSTEKPEFTQLAVNQSYCVLELDGADNPITSGDPVTMDNRLKYQVTYQNGIQKVTIQKNGTADKEVVITNRQYVNMEPGTGILTDSNLPYGFLLGGIAIAGILLWFHRRRRDR